MSKSVTASEKSEFSIHEDWVVVILGFLIIAVALSGVVIPAPKFSWKDGSELLEKVLSVKNLLYIGAQFILTIAIAVVAAYLTKKSILAALKVFPVIYALTLVAIILAGNSAVKAYNLEAVIFSLTIGLLIGNLFKLPEWLRSALTAELFVKIGLVLLGTTVIFADILKAGTLGLVQA